MGLVALEGMHFYAKHGYYAHEKQIGTRYSVDVYIKTNLQKAGESDLLEDTINYETVYNEVKGVMETSKNLIEHLAYEMMGNIIAAHPTIEHIRVRVTKDNPPLQGDVTRTFVEVEKAVSAEENRCTRFCRPLPSHSATRPFIRIATKVIL